MPSSEREVPSRLPRSIWPISQLKAGCPVDDSTRRLPGVKPAGGAGDRRPPTVRLATGMAGPEDASR